MNKILRVNMSEYTIYEEPVNKSYLTAGGRLLISKIFLDEIKPSCHPLGANNKFILATGLLNGTNITSSGRLSIGGKSPLTNGIKESNSGGIVANRLAQMDIKAVIIEGRPKSAQLYNLIIGANDYRLEPADDLAGKGVYETTNLLLSKYPDSAVACIGPAGEYYYKSAGIAITDKDGQPSRYCGRGGMGAVLATKCIKAIVLPDKGKMPIFNKQVFKEKQKEFTKIVNEAASSENYRAFGTAAMVETVNNLGGLPVNNFSLGTFKGADKISAKELTGRIAQRGGDGDTAHACMPGCVIKCSNVYVDQKGEVLVSPLEYETIGLLGSNLGIDDLDAIALLNYECNDIGVDTIEIGAAIGVAMEAGVADFGDVEQVKKILNNIRQGDYLGRIIGNGARITGDIFGIVNVPEVKGQGMPAYDPRAIKGMGVTYATSAMGADHTAGPTARSSTDHASKEGQAELSLKLQKLLPLLDCTGLCLFTVGAIGPYPSLVLDLINSLYGWNLDLDWLDHMATETLRLEQEINKLAGFTKYDNRLSEAFTERPLPNLNTVFDVPDEELDFIVNFSE